MPRDDDAPATAAPLADAEGHVRLEDRVVALADAKRELEEVARLRREFLRNLSHEFATPMTPVVGYLRLLLNEELGPLTALQRKCLESIETSTDRLRALVDTLLDVSQLESGRLHLYHRAYDFAEVARRAIDDTQRLFAERGVSVAQEVPVAPLPAQGDPHKLRRAMVHILDNAAKFTGRGAEVAVGVRSEGAGDAARHRFLVVDSGPGIGDEDRRRILEPFFQVDASPTRQHGGVGIGFAFARHVAEALGGGIEVQSPPRVTVAGRTLPGTAVILEASANPPLENAR